jgi:ubiquinone/menaquinone biosynthesis C-methylase UbiE
MQKLFADMFLRQPSEIVEDDYFFDSSNFHLFNNEEYIKKQFDYIEDAWEQKRKGQYSDIFSFCDEIAACIAREGKPFMEIASGCHMGIALAILIKNPAVPCLITDIQARVIQACRYYIDRRLPENNVNFACFNCQNIPIKDNSFDYVTGNGLGYCVRNEHGFTLQAVHEVYRVLKPGGCYVGIESDYEHNEASVELSQWQQISLEDHDGFLENKLTWQNVFGAIGFKIESAEKCILHTSREFTYINPDDTTKTVKLNSDLVSRATLFIVRKPY